MPLVCARVTRTRAEKVVMENLLKRRIADYQETLEKMMQDVVFQTSLSALVMQIVRSYRNGGKLLICGNGGSAADSQHIAGEFVGKFMFERAPLEAEALTTNTTILTAIGNDYSYNQIFARQVRAKGKKGDVLLGISTSGNAANVVEALIVAKELGLITIGLTGENCESPLAKNVDICLSIPSDSTPRIQEAHIFIGHLLCEYVEKELFNK